jgi:hypothetical protein
MKQGYEVQVQANLPTPLKEEAKRWATEWAFNHKDGYGLGKVAGSNRKTYYNRGSFGIWLDERKDFAATDSGLVFKRISRNRRVFGVVHVDTLERTDGQEIVISQCMCPQHRGGQKVKFKERPQMETVFTWGDIKG